MIQTPKGFHNGGGVNSRCETLSGFVRCGSCHPGCARRPWAALLNRFAVMPESLRNTGPAGRSSRAAYQTRRTGVMFGRPHSNSADTGFRSGLFKAGRQRARLVIIHPASPFARAVREPRDSHLEAAPSPLAPLRAAGHWYLHIFGKPALSADSRLFAWAGPSTELWKNTVFAGLLPRPPSLPRFQGELCRYQWRRGEG
jgi:hypothetical protein